MTIHKKGFRVLFYLLIFVLGVFIILNLLSPAQSFIHYFLYVLGTLFYFSTILFFRKPDRSGQPNDGQIISAADGKVVVLEEVYEEEYFKANRMQVSVFMSISNVHVNWFPVSGIIKYVRYHPGKHLFAWNPKSSTLNERNSVVIANQNGEEILIRQIAGGVARRIVSYGKVNEEMKQRDELGIIKFGSRVDLYLPLNTKLEVKLHQQVRGGATIIGRF
ncbi:MAG: phosphatidylserine decarboxylase family protein [Bacteroidales bacterium]|nr:phosphatidylserine decarboxylase family protein [Bacteroidales bacterium]